MSIDWSKYGVDNSSEQKKSSSEIDWNKYINKDEYKLKDRVESGKLPSFDVEDSPLIQEARQTNSQILYDEPAGPPNPVLPGRDLPVVGPVLRGLDWVASNPVSEAIAEYTVPDQPMIRDGATTDTNARERFLRNSGQEAATGVPKVVAQLTAPFFVPGAGLGTGNAASEAARGLVSRTAPRLQGLGGSVLREGIAGAAVGAGAEFAQGEADPTQALINAGLGAAGGAAFPLIGRGIQAAGSAAGRILTQATERPSLGSAVDDFTKRVSQEENPTMPISEGPSYQGMNLLNRADEGLPSQRATFSKLSDPSAPVGGMQQAARPTLREEPANLNSRVIPEPQSVDEILTVKEPRIRDRVYDYLDEAEKSAKERIAGRKNRLSSTPIDEYADYSIIAAAKIGKGTIKLADLTEQMVKEYGEDIRDKMPIVYRRAQMQLKDAERRATKDAQDAKSFNEQDFGDTATFSGKISREVKKDKTPFSQRIEKIRTQFVDDLAPLEGLEKRVRGKVNSAEDSLYKSARLYRGMPAKANRIVIDRLSPVVEKVESAGFTSKELGDYALAVHAKDVNARDIKSGFTNREIELVTQKYGTPEMEAARKELIKIGDDMLQELADSGVVSRDMFTTLKKRYPNYVPLFRNMDDEKVEFGRGLSNALANVTSPIKKLTGSERQVIDPLENMVKNIFQSTNAAERNKVAKQLSSLAKDDSEQTFIRKLDDVEQVGRKNVVTVLESGEKVRYEVEPEVYKAMLNLDHESSNMLIKALQAPASVLRAGATLTPEFSLRNPMRDVLQAFVTSNSGFNPIVDFPVGIIQAIKKGDLYKQWVRDMGDFGNVVSMDRDAHREALTKVLGEPAGKKFVNIVNGKSLLNVLRAIADTSEAATKVGEYRAALRQGQTPQEAAYRSRDIMDFARAGTGIRQANKVVAFLNANIQGKSKLLRAIKANPVGVSARAFTAVTVPTIGVFLAQKYFASEEQKRIINESPAWLTDTFWLIPIPKTDQVARIPKPFDLAAIFSNAPERALKYVYNNDKEAFDKFASKSIADMALPAQISGLMPFIEGMANYSFFRQGDIIPQGEAGRQYKDQFDINTTETAKGLAAATNKLTGGEGAFKNFSSPRIMDNSIRGLTAGLGSYATSAVDVLLDKLNVTDNPVKPAKGPAQKPLAKAFLVNPLQSGKATEKLYDTKDKLSREKSSAKLNDLKFDPSKEKELKFITKQTDSMSDLTKKIRETEKSRILSAEEKRRLIDEHTRKRNQMAATAARQLQNK